MKTKAKQARRRLIALRQQPATNHQLQLIWPPWNELPADMLPSLRRRILVGSNPHQDPDRRRQLGELCRRFPYLPLDADDHAAALLVAEQWTALMQTYRSTVGLWQDHVDRQWAFRDADHQQSAGVALVRAANELKLTHPGWLESRSPTLAQTKHLETRCAAYHKARGRALDALSRLLYSVPGIRTGRKLPLEGQAVGLPSPPEDVPHYLYIARLDALGICSPVRFAQFVTQDFLRLDRQQRQRFYAASLKPKHGKDPYAAFRVWLLDNRPIFEHPEFGWQWNDVLAAALEKKIECPLTGLKQWASRNGLGLRLKRGPSALDASGVDRSKPLLSPAPVFGDVLKAPPTPQHP